MPRKVQVTPEERATITAAKEIALAITGAVKDCPRGAHVAQLYAPMMAWLSYNQFKALVTFLVESRLVHRDGDTLYPMEPALAELAGAAD
jgi:hypothetical protein